MKVSILRTEADLDRALARMGVLMDRNIRSGDPDSEEFELLSLVIEKYEDAHWPIDPPTPIGAIRFRMEQQGLRQHDLVPYIGSRSKVSEVLSGKRPLSMNMVVRLHKYFGIPWDSLMSEPVEDAVVVANNPSDLRAGARRARRSGDIKAARILETAARE